MHGNEFRGWYNRGYLPHFDTDDRPQMITFRLADSLPRDVVERLVAETEDDEPERHERFQEFLDRGRGSCVLERPECAEIVVENLEFHDGDRYRLLDWVVMPNHGHVTYDQPTVPMATIVHGWKSYTSNRIKEVLGTKGDGKPLWQAGYHDRYARDHQHLSNMQRYIFLNPVRAGLVDNPFDWPHSSIHRHERFRDSIERWWRKHGDNFTGADRGIGFDGWL
jgi:putative transposase